MHREHPSMFVFCTKRHCLFHSNLGHPVLFDLALETVNCTPLVMSVLARILES